MTNKKTKWRNLGWVFVALACWCPGVFLAFAATVDPAGTQLAQVGDVIGPITANGKTVAFKLTGIKEDHRITFQIFDSDTDWNGALVTGEMRICGDDIAPVVSPGLDCPFVTMPVTTWPVTDDASGLIGNVQASGPDGEFRLSVASVGAGTELWFVIRQ